LVQLVVPPKSTVRFVSKWNQFYFGRCKRFSPNFSIIKVAVKELHWLEVEGVVVEFMEGFPWQSLWIFISINFSSQIHRWICVTFKSVLVWEV
jgi:hypothetical protein